MSDTIIELRDVTKSYSLASRPWRRLWGQLSGRGTPGQQHHALRGVNLQVGRGEVVGLVGRNGAGKSTLLQLVCGVLDPSSGQRTVNGRVAALLELGAGFNPELTGRENVRLNGPLLGLTSKQVDSRMDAIIDFAGIGEFVDQPVRSYSSGMFMRLAFSMATSMDPDILVVDEALSVGDGAFARKSFDRIMSLKDRGVTILFCSHSTYHVESICSRAIWLDQGEIRMADEVSRVVAAYNDFIGAEAHGFEPRAAAAELMEPVMRPVEVVEVVETSEAQRPADAADLPAEPVAVPVPVPFQPGHARIKRLNARTPSQSGRTLKLHTLRDDLTIEVDFAIDPELPAPTLITALFTRSGNLVASAGSHNDAVLLKPDARGNGSVTLTFKRLPLLKGDYYMNVILACERGLHYYESAMYVIQLEVTQDGLEQGVVTLEHHWS